MYCESKGPALRTWAIVLLVFLACCFPLCAEEGVVKFDAALMREGDNELTLTVPAGELTSGVVYDYLRLELNDDAN